MTDTEKALANRLVSLTRDGKIEWNVDNLSQRTRRTYYGGHTFEIARPYLDCLILAVDGHGISDLEGLTELWRSVFGEPRVILKDELIKKALEDIEPK